MYKTTHKRILNEISPETNFDNKKYYTYKKDMATEVGKMSVEDLKKLLETTLDTQLTEKRKKIATKDDFTRLYDEVCRLRTANTQLNLKVSGMSQRCELLENQLELISQKAIESSVVVHLPFNEETDATQVALQTCKGLLKIKEDENMTIRSSRAIRNNNAQRSTVIIELRSSEIADKIIAAAH